MERAAPGAEDLRPLEKLSAVVLTFNNEDRIKKCIESLGFVKHLLIYDSFSTDKTAETIFSTWQSLGRQSSDLYFEKRPWPGFVAARNDSLKNVQTEWVLWVDSDEWVSPELRQELRQILSEPSPRGEHYKIPRQSFFLGRAIRFGGWYPDRKARLGRSEGVEWRSGPFGSQVHEDLVARSGREVGFLKGHLYHEPFLTTEEQAETNRRYSALLAEGLAQKYREAHKASPSLARIYFKAVVKFVENYFWKLGFLDGREGFLIATGSAQSLVWRLRRLKCLLEQRTAPK